MNEKPLYTAVVEANRQAQRETAETLGLASKAKTSDGDPWIAKTIELAEAYRAACAAIRGAYDAWMAVRGAEGDTLEAERAYCATLQRAANARGALLAHAADGVVA